ncbi:MAG: hypothetical protein JWL67_1499 [Solirubrobacterales bacterium]|jgi:hypothetical protein|nr:hypothetical protein [Solirubrobacterales bacterium]
MALRVVGAGLGRTGTASLKQALERLLDGRCYHMVEVFERPPDIQAWHSAVRGEPADWDAMLGEYVASVDWPAAAFWRELSVANPEAVVLLSTRDSPEQWWASMERTIVPTIKARVPADKPALARHREMVAELLDRRLTPDWGDPDAAMAAYVRHNEDVRRTADPRRLIEWRPGDGWGPLCAALDVEVPPEPFPHENTTADFRARQGLDHR